MVFRFDDVLLSDVFTEVRGLKGQFTLGQKNIILLFPITLFIHLDGFDVSYQVLESFFLMH